MRAARSSALLAAGLLLAACGPQFVDPPPPTGEPKLSADRFVAADGTVLPIHRWVPAGEPQGLVLALHSFGDFSLAFEEAGPLFAAAGYLVVAPDQRGFGATPEFGRWWGRQTMVDDAVALGGALKAEVPGVPLIFLGESMGGGVALLAAKPAGAARSVLVAPAVRKDLPNRWAYDLFFSSAATLVPGYITEVDHAEPGLTEAATERLGNDPRVLRRVRADLYWGLLRLANLASEQAAPDLVPTLLLYGTADDVVPDVSLCVLEDRLPEGSAVRVYADGRHRLLQEPLGAAAIADALDWLAGKPMPERSGTVEPCGANPA